MLKEDWNLLVKFFPEGWKEQAFKAQALVRNRKIKSPDTLLRVLMIHLADGKSLRTTVAYAKQANLCDISDVSLLKRLKASGEWMRWMALKLLQSVESGIQLNQHTDKFRIRLIDGSSISEPGSTGTDWRIHYSINLKTLHCDTMKVTDPKVGESLTLYPIKGEDLIMADRGYCRRKDISFVLARNGHVIIRLNQVSFPLKTGRGQPFPLLEKLRKLKEGKAEDWDVYFFDMENKLTKGRLCVMEKSKEAAEKAKKDLRRNASRHGRNILPETFEFAEYLMIFTSTNRHQLKCKEILELYRARWQVELAFKRLKSILGVGHLTKFDPDSSKAWLHGKLLIGLLIERIYREAEFFSPWGYPLEEIK